MYFDVALIAYAVDRIFGEFSFIRHPVILMGDYITWFEKRFYKDSLIRGVWLSLSLLGLVFALSLVVQWALSLLPSVCATLALGLVASTAIASKMLYESVQEIVTKPHKIKYLVSRDTNHLSPSDINKAAIETYAENLSDGVIAPLFYLLLWGLPGAFVYKAVNTLDSMVGYRNARYERFGKFAARLDDVANFIPARITAVLIFVLMYRHFSLFTAVFQNGKQHPSPNAGYPISAMAYALGIKLGGPTHYFGTLVPKAYFGCGQETITTEDIVHALRLQRALDIVIILIFSMALL
ncbi:MAG: adenosylcobinamide-phosphate synthase CbiB [Sulfurovum sp.]|nr:adenosylcobinamide-phosphate synthase CbiB [Sulfurovum sp.]